MSHAQAEDGQFAGDVIAVLDHLGVERADVYGTSMGGRVAQWVAALYPERVRRLVLGCTSPGGGHGVERDSDVRRSLGDPDQTAVRRALLDLMYTPAGSPPTPARTARSAIRDCPCAPAAGT
ncbi:alpha/beta hydrolase family protein [Herbihabitans rhizosphaerae]|uniref:Alpha/beta hydrolase family protein n=1 Tax=Herbihabitans rhizosphaerae TaxID=1872711 RepID=A0A4Q7KEG8_9PSEU|nr:alpha/beta hydrolase family protein [Herbihabitans rhizosphaerae]